MTIKMDSIPRSHTNRAETFELKTVDAQTSARAGVLTTAHGTIETPVFMPVGTNATVKAVFHEDLEKIGSQIILANTYHLFLRPGMELIKEAGGLHSFMGWDRPILTDSGGYQVFSLAKLRKIKDEGVEFQSHLDGAPFIFTPENVVDYQGILGSDIMMPLDECIEHPCEKKAAEKACMRTTLWAKRARKHFLSQDALKSRQQLFGIVQGSTFADLRRRSAEELLDIGFDGYAIGGLSVGEPDATMHDVLAAVIPHLPKEMPRYLMGLGTPDQLLRAVAEGVDMFDCCIPTRYGRYGTAFTHQGRLIVRNGEYAKDFRPLDEACDCFVCQKYSRSYVRHLFNTHEILGLTLVSFHNVYFYVRLMRKAREAIIQGRYEGFMKEFLRCYNSIS